MRPAHNEILVSGWQTTPGGLFLSQCAQPSVSSGWSRPASTVSSELLGFGFYFFLIFSFLGRARLRWPPHQLLSAR